MATWKRDFASGLIVLTPILVTVLVLVWLYGRIADLPIVRQVPDPFGALIAVAVFIMLVFSIGYLMRTTAGRLIEDQLDTAMNRVPLIRVLYNASKLAVETAVSGTDDLQQPVRLETWQGVRMTAFQTGRRTDDGREVLFLPTAPNITTGYVIEVDPERVEPTGEGVEQALTRVLSAGFAEEETVERIENLGPSPSVIDEDESEGGGSERPTEPDRAASGDAGSSEEPSRDRKRPGADGD
jgi:uncharacterized membrane protein